MRGMEPAGESELAHSGFSMCSRSCVFTIIVRTGSAVSLAFLLCLCPASRMARPAFPVPGQLARPGWSGSSDSCRPSRRHEPPGGALMVSGFSLTR